MEIMEMPAISSPMTIGNLATIMNPEAIVLGGGVIEHSPQLLEIMKEGISEYALGVAKTTKIIKAKLKEKAALIGIASLMQGKIPGAR